MGLGLGYGLELGLGLGLGFRLHDALESHLGGREHTRVQLAHKVRGEQRAPRRGLGVVGAARQHDAAVEQESHLRRMGLQPYHMGLQPCHVGLQHDAAVEEEAHQLQRSQYYTKLYYTILHYTILHYTILYYARAHQLQRAVAQAVALRGHSHDVLEHAVHRVVAWREAHEPG